jgi:DNA adenine methylase
MFIRYPGSKAKLHHLLREYFPDDMRSPLWHRPWGCYCEPFFGSGAVGWKVLECLRSDLRIVVNDLDPGIASLWQAVRDCAPELVKMVYDFQPSPDLFYRFREEDGNGCVDRVLRGFRKLALHQMSFSGLGAKAGGPLGGREQRSQYNTNCRWNPTRIASRIRQCSAVMRRFPKFEVRCQDFGTLFPLLPDSAFAYLDPPYYAQGGSLYKFAMSDADHERLASLLRDAPFRWLLSYDDHPRVRSLYSWAAIRSFEMTPTISTARRPRRKNREIIITPN